MGSTLPFAPRDRFLECAQMPSAHNLRRVVVRSVFGAFSSYTIGLKFNRRRINLDQSCIKLSHWPESTQWGELASTCFNKMERILRIESFRGQIARQPSVTYVALSGLSDSFVAHLMVIEDLDDGIEDRHSDD
jgi:hypothetical protein